MELEAKHAQLTAERAHGTGLEKQLECARGAQAEFEAGAARSEAGRQREAADLRSLLVRLGPIRALSPVMWGT